MRAWTLHSTTFQHTACACQLRAPRRASRRRCPAPQAAAEQSTAAFKPHGPHPPLPKLAEKSDIPAVRKYLTQIGWQRAWVDNISDRLFKQEFHLTPQQAEAAIDYLQSLSIPLDLICNMMCIAPRALSLPVERLQAVVEYVQGQGITGEGLGKLLSAHPKLLLYTKTADGKSLELGQARAAASVSTSNGTGLGHVSYWRDGAAFVSSPVAPWSPHRG